MSPTGRSGGLLFWLDEDVADVWNGSLQQQSLSGIAPGAKKNAADQNPMDD